VATSFLLLALVRADAVRRLFAWRLVICGMPRISRLWTSATAFLLLALFLAVGRFGSRDPLENLLPLAVWTLWWGAFTVLQAVLGDVWSAFNPWRAPARLLRELLPASARDRPLLAYPSRLGYAPAILGFFAFAWFELVDPAPDDPARLALAVVTYSCLTLAGMLLFGDEAWLARAECFSVFFRFVASIAPLGTDPSRTRLVLACPGARLLAHEPLPPGGVLFVLLTLAAVSFDGFGKTFWWLGLGGINPLEYPGRTALMARNSLGLAGFWAALVLLYVSASALGRRLARDDATLGAVLGGFVLSILPISIGYHFAHYLTAFLVNGQYALLALSDPLERGWDLLGLGHPEVTTSFLSNLASVSVIWRVQAGAVVLVHILAVLIAHAAALRRHEDVRAAMATELPLALFMIGYTCFGLWLLAAPSAG